MVAARKAFVFIVESPSSLDLVAGRSEGRLLSESLRLDRIHQYYYLATDIGVFRRLVEAFKTIVVQGEGKIIPILHISAHASEEGIIFTNGRQMKWSTLTKVLADVNRACKGKLILGLSCCEGNYINLALLYGTNEMPFRAVISAVGAPKWNDAAVAFVVFYHQYINKKVRISDAVSIMNEASKTDKYFLLDYAKITRGRFVKYLHKQSGRT